MDITNILGRVEYLTDALAILEGQNNDPNNDIEEKCIDMFTNLVAIKQCMNELRNVFAEMKEQHQISVGKIRELESLQKRISYIQDNSPKEMFSAHLEESKAFFSVVNDTAITQSTISPIPSSWSQLESPCETQNKHVGNGDNATRNLKKLKNHPNISYITEMEFDTVPKYMKGRLNVSNLNKLIDSFNAAFQKKYETLKYSKRSVKPKDLEYYCEWKREENTEPKGTFFVTGKDVTTFGGTKIDKNVLNMIPILRHLKRIKETRHVNSPLHYVLL